MQDRILDHDEFAVFVMEEELKSRHPENYQWKTNDGTVVNVKDMSDSHLRNAIRMLKNFLWEKAIVQENYVDAMDYYD